MPNPSTVAYRLNQLLIAAGSSPLSAELGDKFCAYLTLLQRWNARTNLTAIRDEEQILSRHFVESILCARYLLVDIVSLLDFGSGAGFPGLPIALLRPEIQVTLAESQNKKAAFLREAVRTLGLTTAVHSGRAEQLTRRFNCVTLRAVDHMDKAIPAAAALLTPSGWLAVMTTKSEAGRIPLAAGAFNWQPIVPFPDGTDRILLLGQVPSE
jgi:16S rRNA (guanine527-N7)-methyltransferase